MIAWRYLDKQIATINALKDYENMTQIIAATSDEIKEVEEGMASPRSSRLDDMPRARNVNSQENILVNNLSRIDILKQRYRLAVEFMEWFKPAWEKLSQEEQMILTEFFLVVGSKTEAVARISEKLFIDRSNVYRRKDKALEHLSVLLYGY